MEVASRFEIRDSRFGTTHLRAPNPPFRISNLESRISMPLPELGLSPRSPRHSKATLKMAGLSVSPIAAASNCLAGPVRRTS